jgi:Fe2+-dicitrate sensor, membrane component
MDKKIIIRYISGKANDVERKEVLDWIESDEENRKTFNRLKNLWVISNLPQGKASVEDVRSFSQKLRKRKIKQYVAWGGVAASILVVAVLFITNQFRYYQSQVAMLRVQELPQFEFKTNRGIKGMVTLPDGSKVWLNSDSYIKCPSKFEGRTRVVEFSGEGYFEVVKNAKVPMVINLGNSISVKVKGTTFNLSSYKDDKDISALLLTGAITIVRHDRLFDREFHVKPNEKVFIQKESNSIDLTEPKETFSTLGWKDGWLVFDETPMQDVIKKLERWHGVSFIVNDPAILNQRFTGRFKEESISQILEMMNQISLVRYEIKDSVVTLKKY